jgi:predicted MFS family arabinose efflux permease
MGRTLVVVGLIVAGIGALMMLGVPLGRLPGDIVVQRGRGTFYFPVVTSIVVSVVLTLLLSLFRR